MRFKIDAIYRNECDMMSRSVGTKHHTIETLLALSYPGPLEAQSLKVDPEWGKQLQAGDFLVLGRQSAESTVAEASFSNDVGKRGDPIIVGVADGPTFDIPEDGIIKLLEARGYRVS